MATCENACNSLPLSSDAISVNTTTIPSFDDINLNLKSCNTDSTFHTAASFSHLQPEVNCLSMVESIQSAQICNADAIENVLPRKPNENHKISSPALENELAQSQQISIMTTALQHSPTCTEKDGISDISDIILNASSLETSDFVDAISLSELSSSTSLSPIDTDENTTQLRFTPTVDAESSAVSSGECTSQIAEANNSNHLYFETTLLAQTQEETSKNEFQEISYFLPTSNDENSDEESSISLSSETTEYPNSTDAASNLNEISASVATLEESSLDSGIASLLDTEQTMNSSVEAGENKQFTKLSSPPKSILGRKRRYCELSAAPTAEKIRENSAKTKVAFDGVTVYYFPRKQSFVTVPSQGGSTLGMGPKHNYCKKMSLNQHKRAIARHRQKVLDEQQKQLQIDVKVKQLRQTYPDMDIAQIMALVSSSPSNDVQESSSSSSEEDEDDDNSSSDEDLDDDNYFPQPIPAKKRRLLLRMAGVQKIESDEKFSNKLTRESREICGCDCEKVCLPSSCQCALAGIPCQVDRESFPCGCMATGCRNTRGRVEFDAERVQRHYFQTMKKLRLLETGMASGEVEELPQPPKSPYVSALERDNELYGENTQDGQPSMQLHSYAVSSAEPMHAAYDQSLQISNSPLFTSSAVDSWTMSYPSNDRAGVASSAAYGNNDTHPNPGVAFDNFSCSQETPYFDSSNFSDVTPAFLTPEVNSMEYMMPPPSTGSSTASMVNYDQTCRDFSFAEEHLATSSGESKLSSVFAEGAQVEYRQTFRLDPITSFFPANGRRLSQETSFFLDLPGPCNHVGELNYQSSVGSSSTCKQPCSIESLLCPEEQSSSRSRSSSLSECSHDSIVKA